MARMKILAVDDNPSNLTMIEQELKENYEVISMLTGRRAIRYLLQEEVDLVLLDVQMPTIDGIETLQEIRNLENGGATLPVIFLTAMKDRATVIAGAKLGIMDYITKPFDATELRDRIEQVFMRLGKTPVSREVLLKTVEETLTSIEEERPKITIAKLDEMQGYQTEEEIYERIRHVKLKYNEGDLETATNMLERLRKVLMKDMEDKIEAEQKPITVVELRAKLLFVLADLENFYILNAKNKIIDLETYAIEPAYLEYLEHTKKCLDEFDDTKAEEVLRELLTELKNQI